MSETAPENEEIKTESGSKIDVGVSAVIKNRFYPSILMVAAGGMLIFFSQMIGINNNSYYGESRNPESSLIIYMAIAGIFLVVIGAASSSFAYLAGTPRTRLIDPNLHSVTPGNIATEQSSFSAERHLAEFQKKALEEISNILQANIALNPLEQKKISDSIRRQITSNIAADIIRTHSELKNPLIQNEDLNEIRLKSSEIRNRLYTEISALTRRGNLNLVIGGITTILAVGLLAYIVLSITSDGKDINYLIWTYVPRLSVAIFIEVFSFFFLKLYKASLGEIKYFQNELTNIDMKNLALEAAILTRDMPILNKLIEEFSKTERNFRLQKDESTVDIEKAKLETQNIKDFMASLSAILKRDK